MQIYAKKMKHGIYGFRNADIFNQNCVMSRFSFFGSEVVFGYFEICLMSSKPNDYEVSLTYRLISSHIITSVFYYFHISSEI